MNSNKTNFSQDLRNKAVIDYLRLILLENFGIDRAIINDEKAPHSNNSFSRVALISRSLVEDSSPFHEIVHTVQNFDIFVRKNFEGNRYYMLKDEIICTNIPTDVYEANYQENGPSS